MSAFLHQQAESVAGHLARHLKGEVRFDLPTRRLFATDASIYQMLPLGVVLPRDADDVAA